MEAPVKAVHVLTGFKSADEPLPTFGSKMVNPFTTHTIEPTMYTIATHHEIS